MSADIRVSLFFLEARFASGELIWVTCFNYFITLAFILSEEEGRGDFVLRRIGKPHRASALAPPFPLVAGELKKRSSKFIPFAKALVMFFFKERFR